MDFNMGTLVEAVADALGDEVALAHGDRRTTWTDFDQRTARLAAGLGRLGAGQGSKVGLYLHNGPEYLESAVAAFKIGAAPVNVNYRYRDDELAYLLDNADVDVLVYGGSLAERVERVRGRVTGLRALVQVDDHDVPLLDGALFHHAVVEESDPAPRSERGDDLMLLYTGGTTGMPKGVMWRTCDLLSLALPRTYEALGFPPAESVEAAAALARKIVDAGRRPVHLAACPQMHGTGFGTSLHALVLGGAVVTLTSRRFDAHELWRAVEREQVTQIAIVGDPFAKPMVAALEEAEARGEPYDLGSLQTIASSGAMWSASVKRALLERAALVLQDTVASSEALGIARSVTTRSGQSETAHFDVGDHAVVVSDGGVVLSPDAEEIGMLAVSHPVPLGYYKDPERTDALIRTIDGVRYVMTGDYARYGPGGRIVLLGRGSVCINTGGEKVFSEEVEEVLKEHPAVLDAIVVGVPDEVWGEAVAAVVSFAGAPVPTGDLQTFVRAHLADFKCPKRIVAADHTPRGPNGKADYAAARMLVAPARLEEVSIPSGND